MLVDRIPQNLSGISCKNVLLDVLNEGRYESKKEEFAGKIRRNFMFV